MGFRPTAEKLLPDLSPREEIAILARTLWHEGYDDHLAGHITVKQPDGTLLCNPWYLLWCEVRPEDVIRIDLDGNVLEGDWPAPLGIPLHLELHKLRDDVEVALHSHPRYGTVWADARRIPPVADQSSAGGGGRLVLVDEYEGGVSDSGLARSAVEAMGDAELALLGGHGVFVLGNSIRAVHQRAVALEIRCRNAWMAEALGGGVPLPADFTAKRELSKGDGFIGYWEAMARLELERDPDPARPPLAIGGPGCVATRALEGRSVEAVNRREGSHRAPLQARHGLLRPAHGHDGGEGVGLGEGAQLPHRGLDPAQQRGEHRAQARIGRAEQQVVDERVDRRAPHDAGSVQLRIGDGQGAQVDEDEQQHRDLVQPVDVRGGRARRRALRRGIARRERDQAAAARVHVRVVDRQLQVAQAPAHPWVAHDEHVPALAVAAAAREPGPVEDPGQDRVWHGLAPEVPRGSRRAHRLVQLHADLPCRPSTSAVPRRWSHPTIPPVRGIVWDGEGLVLTDDLVVRDPGPGEVQVWVHASGICQSDLHVVDGTAPMAPPVVLGHEAAGVVTAVGVGVDAPAVGDRVVIASVRPCRRCARCEQGRLGECREAYGRASHPFTWHGQPVRAHASIGSFASVTTVRADQAVPVPADVALEAAALVGCAVTTGFGSVRNVAHVEAGSDVVVVGVGGIGVNVVQTCRLQHARRIVAVDVNPAKEPVARRFGATDVLVGVAAADLDAAVRAVLPGGADVVFECSGVPAVIEAAVGFLAPGGTCVLIGIPPRGTQVSFDVGWMFDGRRIVGAYNGAIRPHHDIPLVLDLARAGHLDVAGQVSATWPVTGFAAAIAALRAGEVVRAVLLHDTPDTPDGPEARP